jgi:hypothetical protein
MKTMLATVFHGVNDIRVDSVPKPYAGPGEAVITDYNIGNRAEGVLKVLISP